MLAIPTPFPEWCTGVGIALMILGIAIALVSIVRHNGGLFTGGETGYLATLRPAARIAICGGIGALFSLISIVPGIHMIVTGDVSALHSYHYAGIAAADLPRFATCEGLCLVGVGVSILLCMLAAGGMVGSRPFRRWAVAVMAVGVALLCLSLVGLLVSIPYFGGSLNP